jgi:hypothetical protein
MCFFHVPLFNLAWVNRYQYFRKKPEKLFLASKLCRRNIGINLLWKKVLEVNGKFMAEKQSRNWYDLTKFHSTEPENQESRSISPFLKIWKYVRRHQF